MSESDQKSPEATDLIHELLNRAVTRAVELLPATDTDLPPQNTLNPEVFVQSILARRTRVGEAMPTKPSAEAIETPDQILATLGPRYPGQWLLESPSPAARVILRMLIGREVEAALELVKTLTASRLTKWVRERLIGTYILSETLERTFVTLVAEVNREVWEAEARRAVQGLQGAGLTTLAELTRDTALDTVASQPSVAAVGLAEASRKLEIRFPALGEILLLSFYAGLAPTAVATLTGQAASQVESSLAEASHWVLAQTVY